MKKHSSIFGYFATALTAGGFFLSSYSTEGTLKYETGYDWDGSTLKVNIFDSNIGTLNSVELYLSGMSEVQAGFYYNTAEPGPDTVSIGQSEMSISLPKLSLDARGSGPEISSTLSPDNPYITLRQPVAAWGYSVTTDLTIMSMLQQGGGGTIELAANMDVYPGLAQSGPNSSLYWQTVMPFEPQFFVIYDFTPVPEPSTYVAGALLLLPFGLQGIRCLRNRKQA